MMKHGRRSVLTTVWLAAVLAAAANASGQGADQPAADTPAPKPAGEPPALNVPQVQAALEGLEADATIDESIKAPLRDKYQEALTALQTAADLTATAEQYRGVIQSGPDQLAQLDSELKATETGANAPTEIPEEPSQLEAERESRRVSLELLREQLAKVVEEALQVETRPLEIPTQLAELQRELADTRARLKSPELVESETGPSRAAERMLLRANEARLASEVAMLEQEQLSQATRERLLKAQRALLESKIEQEEQLLERLSQALSSSLSSTVERVRRVADAVPQELVAQDATLQAITTEVRVSADELEEVIRDAKQTDRLRQQMRVDRETLAVEFASTREQLELGGAGRAITQLLFRLDRRCLQVVADLREGSVADLAQSRIDALQVRERLREQSSLEEQLAADQPDQVAAVVAARREVLEELDRQYSSLTRALAVTEKERQQYVEQAEEVRGFVAEKLFGFDLKVCPALSGSDLRQLPEAIGWFFQLDHWQEVAAGLSRFAQRRPVVVGAVLLLVAALLAGRRWLRAALEQTGRQIRRVSTDRCRCTVEALLWSVLLALPIPLLLASVAWALTQAPVGSDWFAAFRAGLQRASWIVLAAAFAISVLHPGGLAVKHFGWRPETTRLLRGMLRRATLVYTPSFVVAVSCTYGEASTYLGSLGRVSLVLAHLWIAAEALRLAVSSKRFLEHPHGESAPRSWTRWRSVGLALLLLAPLCLVGLMIAGYVITSLILSLGLLVTLAIIGGGALLQGLALRWFAIGQRKLALEEAIERRRTRQREEHDENASEATEVIEIDAEDAPEIDVEAVASQTRELLGATLGLAVFAGVVAFWSRAFPILNLAGSVTIPFLGGLTLLRLVSAILIAAVTWIVVKNLPGLLESTLLRSSRTPSGTRLAIYTLCQYAAVAIGAWLFLNAIQVEWAQFGWAVAALSVGLGFGLQEVVANFVCGLILLLERPIRVGDIVTVEDTTGTVSKIHLRATTITNWDRQEFVVPNKTLITSTLLNWTLSAPLNRVVIPVGVAYGSDTEQARSILLSIAEQHPNVLDDPRPMATFEQFADSSLNIILRVYLPDLDSRLSTISELHTAINDGLAEAGIEIAFPQRDLHLRSGWPTATPASQSEPTEA